MTFETEELRSTVIREGEQYEGLRVTMPTRVGSAKIKLQLDINFAGPGDARGSQDRVSAAAG